VPGSHGRRVLTTSAPVGIAARDGRTFTTPGPISGITSATATSFPTRRQGWVLGTRVIWITRRAHSRSSTLLMHTTDGGRTWQVGLRL
jgi:hypothetical protein